MRTVLIGNAAAHVEAERSVLPPVRLSLSDALVITGPYTSASEHERHLLSTVGAGNWVDAARDEMRFVPRSGRLASLWLQIPETVTGTEVSGAGWLGAERTAGDLALLRGEDFTLPPVRSRWCADDGSALVCVTVAAHDGGAARQLRVSVAEDLDLLFRNEEYVGWLLLRPERHLSASWTPPSGGESDPQLGAWLAEYLSMVDESTVKALEDGDRMALGALTGLAGRVAREAYSSPRRRVLSDHLAELSDWFE